MRIHFRYGGDVKFPTKALYLQSPDASSAYGFTSIREASFFRNRSYKRSNMSAVCSFLSARPTDVATFKASSLLNPENSENGYDTVSKKGERLDIQKTHVTHTGIYVNRFVEDGLRILRSYFFNIYSALGRSDQYGTLRKSVANRVIRFEARIFVPGVGGGFLTANALSIIIAK